MQDLIQIEKAKNVAYKRHETQTLSDGKPYSVHLDNVVRILIKFGHTETHMICGGYLHDTVEDTDLTLDEIRRDFGDKVADLVYRVTDEAGATRKERKMKTYPKIKGEALAIKLADRIANVTYNNDPEFIKMYKKEQPEFERQCRTHEYPEMWAFLDNFFKTH